MPATARVMVSLTTSSVAVGPTRAITNPRSLG